MVSAMIRKVGSGAGHVRRLLLAIAVVVGGMSTAGPLSAQDTATAPSGGVVSSRPAPGNLTDAPADKSPAPAALADLAKGRTTITISHRLRNIVKADQIAVMEEGRIVERGSFASPRARGGRAVLCPVARSGSRAGLAPRAAAIRRPLHSLIPAPRCREVIALSGAKQCIDDVW